MLGVTFVLLVATVLVLHLADRARANGDRCARFATASVERGRTDTGTGSRVVVIGDSWSAGLGLDRSVDSWPSRLPGRVHVAGFSGSGFSTGAGSCRDEDFARRAPSAVRGGADLVVVEGGLNDFDEPSAAVRAGFARLMAELKGMRVVVVGPALAPARADAVPRVDDLLATLAESYDVPYVQTSGLSLPYLDDQLHLTPAGHVEFGDFVAQQIEALPAL